VKCVVPTPKISYRISLNQPLLYSSLSVEILARTYSFCVVLLCPAIFHRITSHCSVLLFAALCNGCYGRREVPSYARYSRVLGVLLYLLLYYGFHFHDVCGVNILFNRDSYSFPLLCHDIIMFVAGIDSDGLNLFSYRFVHFSMSSVKK